MPSRFDDPEAGDRSPSTEAPKQGFVEMKKVESALYDVRRRFRACYEKEAARDPSLEGIVWLSLTLDTTGRIRGVVAEPRSTLRSESLISCLQRRFAAVRLPPAEGGPVTFSYPLEFGGG